MNKTFTFQCPNHPLRKEVDITYDYVAGEPGVLLRSRMRYCSFKNTPNMCQNQRMCPLIKAAPDQVHI